MTHKGTEFKKNDDKFFKTYLIFSSHNNTQTRAFDSIKELWAELQKLLHRHKSKLDSCSVSENSTRDKTQYLNLKSRLDSDNSQGVFLKTLHGKRSNRLNLNILPEKTQRSIYKPGSLFAENRFCSETGIIDPEDEITIEYPFIGTKNSNQEKTLKFAVYAQNLTGKIQCENEIRGSENRFLTLLESALVGIAIIKGEKFIYKNYEYKKIMKGFPDSFDQLISRHIHPDDIEPFRVFYQKVLSGDHNPDEIKLRFFTCRNKAPGKGIKWIRCKAIRISYQRDHAVLLNILDITQTKHLKQMVQVNDRMCSLGRIATGISHEIRNPLSTINVCLSVIKRYYQNLTDFKNEDSKLFADTLSDMESASNRIEGVIRKVMDFAKPGTHQLNHTCINQCVYNALELSSVALKKMDIHITTQLDQKLPKCFLDNQAIVQVILNLITNAAESMHNCNAVKRIDIETCQKLNYIVLTLSDSGPGIPSDIRSKIFDPFFTTKKSGSGIGLNICKRIVTDHGGFLNVSSSKYEGAEFTIGFPVKKRRDNI